MALFRNRSGSSQDEGVSSNASKKLKVMQDVPSQTFLQKLVRFWDEARRTSDSSAMIGAIATIFVAIINPPVIEDAKSRAGDVAFAWPRLCLIQTEPARL